MVEQSTRKSKDEHQAQKIKDESRNLQQEIVQEAESRLAEFQNLKADFFRHGDTIELCVAEIRRLVLRHSNLITRDTKQLLSCLRLQLEKFREYLSEEEAHWVQNLNRCKRQAGEIARSADNYIEKT